MVKKIYRNVISQSNITAVTTRRTSRLLEDGDTVAMMEVFVRPPSESCRILVSFDSLWEEIIQRMINITEVDGTRFVVLKKQIELAVEKQVVA